ncbi:MAG: thioredoxin domain-containing protein [Pseudomonadota bacterium]
MNRLANESSLYLQQHKDNPVDWWPWGEPALTEARNTGKPILLSVGYSACHWCHVMAHESFESSAIAAVMNEHFINIKVDREERPDIDKIYQTAHQLMAQRPGGWPLTMFLTPDAQLPFFGGTYFPPEPRQGMPGFVEVLEKVAEFHNGNPEEATRQGTAVQEVFSKLEPEQRDDSAIDSAPANLLRHVLAQQFDETNGGFGRAPKFPQTPSLLRMLNHWREGAESDEPDLQALLMAALSQTRMIHGGLFDQVGGGFFRYCVDADWQIPHFEKMLYDNGQLLSLLAATAVATGDENFVAAASATADWLLRDMRHTNGGFFATLDADSEGGEGAFYTFTPEAIEDILTPEAAALALELFGLTEPANFEGRWHLVQRRSIEEAAESRELSARGLREQVNAIRSALRGAREQRPSPGRDEKILTSWNALAIRGLTEAARATGNGA